MKRIFLLRFGAIVMTAALLLGMVSPTRVHAQSTQQAGLTFADLGLRSATVLTGPTAEMELQFNLPKNWAPEGTAMLDLDFSAFFTSLMVSEYSETISGLVGGDLSVELNDQPLGVVTLQQSGEQSLHLEFDAALFKPVFRGEVNTLRIRWDGLISCLMNLLSSVTISPSSRLTFDYNTASTTLTLNAFPAPFIVNNSIQPEKVRIVLPSNPSAGELNAALIVAAAVGQISGGEVEPEVITLESFLPVLAAPQQVFLIANADTFRSLNRTTLGIADGILPPEGEGVLHLFNHAAGYGLLVSGDENGIVKAAQAVGTGELLSTGDGRTMVVREVHGSSRSTGTEDMTLEDLGVGELVFSNLQGLTHKIDFYVPAGNQVRADATLDLVLSHSQQLDYMRSGLQMLVNDYPAVSLRLTDNTANQTLFRLILPANLVHVGRNTITFTATVNLRDLCSAPTEEIAWLRVSSASLLHLPLESAVGGAVLPRTFADYPEAFLTGAGLDNVVIGVDTTNFAAIQTAARVAAGLGAGLGGGDLLKLRVLPPSGLEEGIAAEDTVIVVGAPADFAILAGEQYFPALVFDETGGLSSASQLAVVPGLPDGAKMGLVSVRGYTAPSSRVLLAVLGNSPASLTAAADALFSRQSAGYNLVLATEAGDTNGWFDVGISTGKAAETPSGETPVVPGVDPVQTFRVAMLKWAVPALAVLLVVMLLFLYLEIRAGIRKTN